MLTVSLYSYQSLFRFSVSTKSIMRVLIENGANVNEIQPIDEYTPLHLFCSGFYFENLDDAISIIKLLLDANAHMDCVDAYGRRPEERAHHVEIRQLLQENQKLSLKCRCARMIIEQNLYYEKYLSKYLIKFVRMHGKYKKPVLITDSDYIPW